MAKNVNGPLSYTSVALNGAGYCSAGTTSGATNLFTLLAGAATGPTGTLPAAGLSYPVTIKNNSATDHSAKTYTITGTDENGAVVSETAAMPAGNATVTSTQFFATVTSVVVSATCGADTFDIGWTASAKAPAIYLNYQTNAPFNVGISVKRTSGTYTVNSLLDGGASVAVSAGVTNATSSQLVALTVPSMAIQLTLSVAGTVVLTTLQPGAF